MPGGIGRAPEWPDQRRPRVASGPVTNRRARQTHHLRRDRDLITKTYRTWGRQEHHREWTTLNLLALHQPGLAPEPISAELDREPPSITMTALPGDPIVGYWTDDQIHLLAKAMRRLWDVPGDRPAPIDMHNAHYWRHLAARSLRPASGVELRAFDLTVDWITGPALNSLLDGRTLQILGQGDPQPGNMLYDGRGIRLVDFEDAGASDVCFELANFAEHLGARGTGLDRLADLIDHDHRRYHLYRRLIASFWLFRLLPDPTGARPPRTAELHDQAVRLIDLFD
ncbi:phosphotransferase [Microlunatus elymi]